MQYNATTNGYDTMRAMTKPFSYPSPLYGSRSRFPDGTPPEDSILAWHRALARAPRGVQFTQFVLGERLDLVVDGGAYTMKLTHDSAMLECASFVTVRRCRLISRRGAVPEIRWLPLDRYIRRMVQAIAVHRLTGCHREHPLPQGCR